MMAKRKKSTHALWQRLPSFRQNILFYLAGFLLVFIPLYPKLPLADILPGYIVRLRLEDVFISLTILIFLYKVKKEKIKLSKNPLFWPMIVYLIAGALSILSGMFITHSIPLVLIHIAKAVLHLIRRVEYFSLFFILYYAVRNISQLKAIFGMIVLSITGVIVYGYGQKYLLWPVFSTMNREFAKGVKLYLMEHGRVSSTFGGHYDLATFIVMGLILVLALAMRIKNKMLKIFLYFVFILQYWLLVLTVSRTSFGAYIGAVTLFFLFLVFRQGILWSVWRWLVVVFFSVTIMFFFGDLSDRYAQLLGLQTFRTNLREQMENIAKKPSDNEGIPVAASDIPPQADPDKDKQIVAQKVTDKSGRPADVEVEPVIIEATDSGSATSSYNITYPTYSENALKYGLSVAIRLDALWPRAIAGFKANPILGSGYSTLTKEKTEYFTYAESTDNDFLRMLGETGLSGTLSFFAILIILIRHFWKFLRQKQNLLLSFLGAAGLAIIAGMLINAFYIDVFEASKVAYSFWAFMGLILISGRVLQKENE